jgi:hypothetical protein
MKNFVTICIILFTSFAAFAQQGFDRTPHYMKSDFFEKYPEFQKYPFNNIFKSHGAYNNDKIKVADEARFLSEDGIPLTNLTAGADPFNSSQSETWIAVNPANPDNAIATCNDYWYVTGSGGQGIYKMPAWVTEDGGKTWSYHPTQDNWGVWFSPSAKWAATIFDPGVEFDLEGNAYYVYGFAETRYGDDEREKNQNGVYVVKSTTGGKTWDGAPVDGFNVLDGISAVTTDATGSLDNNFHDRYSIAVDISPNSPWKGNVYVTWKIFPPTGGGTVVLSRSTDGAGTWSDSYLELDEGGQAPMPVVGPDGTVYATWIQAQPDLISASAMFARIGEGGTQIEKVTQAQKVYSVGDRNSSNGRFEMTNKRNIRVSSTPQIACDISEGPNKGRVYIVQAGREEGLYGIYIAYSDDEGETWESNIRIDNNDLRNDMIMPSITCDPVTGTVAVLYYSSQNDPQNEQFDAYVAISQDGGATWSHYNVAPHSAKLTSSNDISPQGVRGGNYWGDYTRITSYGGKIYPLFWLENEQNQGFGSLDLYTALISDTPTPPTDISSQSILEGGPKIKLTWANPSQTFFGNPIGEFKINVFRDGNLVAEVDGSSPAEYIDENVTDGETYTYGLQAETSGGTKSEIIYFEVTAGGSPVPSVPYDISWKPVPQGISISWTNPEVAVDGSELRGDLALEIYDMDSDELIGTLDDASIQAGVQTTLDLALDAGYYNIGFKLSNTRDANTYRSAYAAETFVAYAGELPAELNENFDGNEIIPHYVTGKWGISTEAASSSPNVIADSPGGNYEDNSSTFMQLAPVVVPQDNNVLSFNHICLVRDNFNENANPPHDYAMVAVSADFGKTWEPVKFFDVNSSPDEHNINSLESSTFTNIGLDFSGYAGETVLIRFFVVSNDILNAAGWYIDDIMFGSGPVGVEEFSDNDFSARIFPNPASDESALYLKLKKSSSLQVTLYDALGNKIADIANQGSFAPGNYEFGLNSESLVSGSYYAVINFGTHTRTVPFVIAK